MVMDARQYFVLLEVLKQTYFQFFCDAGLPTGWIGDALLNDKEMPKAYF